MANVKGSAFATRIRWLRLQHGEAGVAKVAALASPGLAGMLEAGVTMATWYPFEWFVELNTVLDKLWGEGDFQLARELGAYGASANLTTIYRLFFKFGTPKWVIARAAKLWSVHYDSGKLLVRAHRGDRAELEIANFATPHRAHCLAVAGWAQRSLELSGARFAKVVETSCRARGDNTCVLDCTW